jgi:hypothetical protein
MNQNIRNDENISEFTQYTIKNLAQFNFNYFSFSLLTELSEGQEEQQKTKRGLQTGHKNS